MRRLQGGSQTAGRLADNSIRQMMIASASSDTFGVGADALHSSGWRYVVLWWYHWEHTGSAVTCIVTRTSGRSPVKGDTRASVQPKVSSGQRKVARRPWSCWPAGCDRCRVLTDSCWLHHYNSCDHVCMSFHEETRDNSWRVTVRASVYHDNTWSVSIWRTKTVARTNLPP